MDWFVQQTLPNGMEELPLAVLQLSEHRDSATLTCTVDCVMVGVAKSDFFRSLRRQLRARSTVLPLLSRVASNLRRLVPNDWPQPVSEYRPEIENVTIH